MEMINNKKLCPSFLIRRAEKQLEGVEQTIERLEGIFNEMSEALDYDSMNKDVAILNTMAAQIQSFKEWKITIQKMLSTFKLNCSN